MLDSSQALDPRGREPHEDWPGGHPCNDLIPTRQGTLDLRRFPVKSVRRGARARRREHIVDRWLDPDAGFAGLCGHVVRHRLFRRHTAALPVPAALRPIVYSLALAVYCSSWTFYGAVGSAAQSSLSYLPIYLGPILLFVFFSGLLQRLTRVAKANNITSIADFISSRFGKSHALGALVTVIAVTAAVPYIALQFKAVAHERRRAQRRRTLARAQVPLLNDPGLLRGGHAGVVRDPVRHPAHRRDRASSRHDAGDCGRVGDEAGRLRRDRALRAEPAAWTAPQFEARACSTKVARDGLALGLPRPDPARVHRHVLPAAPVPGRRGRMREPGRRAEKPHAVSALPCHHLHVRVCRSSNAGMEAAARHARSVRMPCCSGCRLRTARTGSRFSPISADSRLRPAWSSSPRWRWRR